MVEEKKMLSCKCNSVSFSSRSFMTREGEKTETSKEDIATGMSCDCDGEHYDSIELLFTGAISPGEMTAIVEPPRLSSIFASYPVPGIRERVIRVLDGMPSLFS